MVVETHTAGALHATHNIMDACLADDHFGELFVTCNNKIYNYFKNIWLYTNNRQFDAMTHYPTLKFVRPILSHKKTIFYFLSSFDYNIHMARHGQTEQITLREYVQHTYTHTHFWKEQAAEISKVRFLDRFHIYMSMCNIDIYIHPFSSAETHEFWNI